LLFEQAGLSLNSTLSVSVMPIEELVEDWSTVMRRWQAWWEHEILDRVVIAVTAPKAGAPPVILPVVDPETQWTNAEYMVQRALAVNRATYFGGDALPSFSHGWSVGNALYLGCQPHFAPDTVWVDPASVNDFGYPNLGEEWHQNPWWQWILETTRTAAEASHGRYFMQSLWGNLAGDTLALVRGTENLLLDVITDPAWAKLAVKRISDIQVEAIEAVWQIMGPGKLGVEGSQNYVGCWSPGRTMGLDCDISCMISPESFKEIFLPPLIETMNTIDHRIYHLDGPGALSHLETLLAIPDLQAIQWVPGAGHEAIQQWIPLIQHVQKAGKNIAVIVDPAEIDMLLDEVKPEGLFISTTCTSEEKARRLLEHLARY
jgi:hypothetical protein